MPATNRKRAKYFARHADLRPLLGEFPRRQRYRQAVIIPALAERQELPRTLAALAANPKTELACTLVVVVVNNVAPAERRAVAHGAATDNARTLTWLHDQAPALGLALAWVDASSPGRELPTGTGVGLARKIGADSALEFVLSGSGGDVRDPLEGFALLHLDADTLVERNYLSAVAGGLTEGGAIPGAVVPFAHQAPDDPGCRAAVESYELFMRYYVEGLRWVGSPYAFHSMGSAMACTANGYVRAGGCPAKRTAGEDFYFLQDLLKTGGVRSLGSTTVHPSARLSERVPFGTGPRLGEILRAPDTYRPAYDPRVFAVLGDLFGTVERLGSASAERVLQAIAEPACRRFLHAKGFGRIWAGLQKHSPSAGVSSAFHCWFDALATVRLARFLSKMVWPPLPVQTGWRTLAAVAGLDMPSGLEASREELLAWARQRQGRPRTHVLP